MHSPFRRLTPLLVVPLALPVLVAPPASAAPASSAAPARATASAAPPECNEEPRDLPTWKFVDYREMRRELAHIERISRGRVDVKAVGKSNRGRTIYTATVGTGKKVFLVTSEIHGNEKTGTTALLRILKWLGTSGSPEAKRLRRTVTFVAVPKINPDGAELDRRGNDNAWAEVQKDFPQLAGRPPAWNYLNTSLQGDDYTKRPGFDLNRDFNPNLKYVPKPEDVPGESAKPGWFLNPESQTLRDIYTKLRARKGKVDVYVDLHHQGACVREDAQNRLLDVAVDYPPLPDKFFEPGGKYAAYAKTYAKKLSKQLAVSAFRGIEKRGYIGARYPHAPTRDLPGQARCSLAMIGTGTVLFEVRGQTQTMGHQQSERFTRAVTAGLTNMLNDLSTGRVYGIDPDTFERFPGTVEDAAATAFRHAHDGHELE
ncbi:M14 family zinc carboxypeptidase [Actinomadura fulvescens]|uniref:Peptidase M14 domain-containing protein n=1 Tax=Actinomadura fulvescens TaxID=46160 RepID=A0ABP6C9F7_9ACTN